MGGKSIYTDEVWNTRIGPRYRDERQTTGKVMAAQLGIHEVTLTSQMRRRGFYRQRERETLPTDAAPAESRVTRSDLLGFDYDPTQPRESIAAIEAQAARAAREGRLPQFRELVRCKTSVLIDSGLQRPSAHDADAPGAAVDEPARSLTLREAQQPPQAAWSTWLFIGGLWVCRGPRGSAPWPT